MALNVLAATSYQPLQATAPISARHQRLFPCNLHDGQSVQLPEVVARNTKTDRENHPANDPARGAARHLASDVAAHNGAARHGQTVLPVDFALHDEPSDRQGPQATR